ncbi:MAG: homogentisate phytyltransferase [Bacteroidetes bacterium]|nr:homogentisate phytyltransferase [Bacteroidota bacterium]
MKDFIRFSRPHTVIGTSLSILALYFLAIAFANGEGWYLEALLITWISCLGANIYIVGLNQITDVEIDKMNKPYLPLASGAYSMRKAWWIIGFSVFISLVLAVLGGRFLLLTVLLSLVLGTAYSLPPVRLKRFHFWAAFCIIAVRSLFVNLLLFLHFNEQITGVVAIPPAVWLLTAVIFVYSIAIAWFKDIPDMDGDKHFRINTLSLHWGAKRVFRTGITLIVLSCLSLMILPWGMDLMLNPRVLSVAHVVILLLLILAAKRTNLSDTKSVFSFYQFVWVLFFLEYIAFGMAGWFF